MQFKVLYFAQLSEQLGLSKEVLEVDSESSTINEVKSLLSERGPEWKNTLESESTKCAINQELVHGDLPLKNGDEIAFFPPMTGG